MRRGMLALLAVLVAACTSQAQPATTTIGTAATGAESSDSTISTGASDRSESLGRLPDGTQYALDLDTAIGEVSPEGIYAVIEIDLDEAPFTGDDIGCPACSQPVLGITTFYTGSGQDQDYDAGVYRASSGDWTMQIEVYEDVLEAWGGDGLEVALMEHVLPVDVEAGLPTFELSGPFQWTEDFEVPHFMEVLYPEVVVRRGCDESSIACSQSRAVQVVPLQPEDWNPEWTVRISDSG